MKISIPRIKNIDRLIYFFLLFFAATLNNSIFLNQIGFFSVYLLIIIKSIYFKDNPIKKTELNKSFLIFILIILFTALFSIYKEEALVRSVKKILLIPIVYSIVYCVDNRIKSEKIIKSYLGFALVTILIYLIFSLYHFIYHLYSLESKGPSPFQYVMTAGGLMSFTVIFFFSYLIHEKSSRRVKIFLFISFIVALIGVLASYTRAAWVGTIFGLLSILLIKRKWKFIITFIFIIILFIVTSSNESRIEFYKINIDKINLVKTFDTKGRANDLIILNNDKLIADYENGILILKKDYSFEKLKFSVPIGKIMKWNDSIFVAYSLDQRFFLLKTKNQKLNIIDTFYTKGRTVDFKVYQDKFYVADEDSGLTIFDSPNKLKSNFIKYKGISQFIIKDSCLFIYNRERQSLLLKKIINEKSFVGLDSIKINSSVGYIFNHDAKLIFQSDNELLLFKLNTEKIEKVKSLNLIGCIKSVKTDSSIYLMTNDGKLFKANILSNDFTVNELYNFNKPVKSFDIKNDTLIIAYHKRSRFTSIFDKYHVTNYERLNIWKTGLKIFRDYPILGVGDIDLQKVYQKYKEPYLKENFGHLHNNFINWLVVYGLVGTILILYFFINIFLFFWKMWKKNKNEKIMSSFILGSIASFIAFVFSGFGEYNFGDQEIMTVLWFILGMNIAFSKILSESKTK